MYENLASFYDSFTDDLDREKEARFLESVFLRFGNAGLRAVAEKNMSCGDPASVNDPMSGNDADPADHADPEAERLNGEDIDASTLVIDVGCGTGDLSVIMSRRGYDVTGLDVSAEMLEIASQKAESSGEKVLWLCQDMCEMDTYGSYAAMFCLTDGVNHILGKDRLRGFFSNARNFIDPGGLLIFDFLPPRYFKRIAREGILCDTREEGCCVWWGSFRRGVIDYEIDCFVASKDSPGDYKRYCDSVSERGWTLRLIKRLLRECGFSILSCGRFDEGKTASVNGTADASEETASSSRGLGERIKTGRLFVVARRR